MLCKIFRNDDLAYKSDIEKYKEIQGIFEEFGIKEMYSVVPFGQNLYVGDPFRMELASLERYLGTAPVYTDWEVDGFIRESLRRGHSISLHGWTHTRIAMYDFTQQLAKISEAKRVLEETYETKIEYFVPPYNNYNEDTRAVCNMLDMKILDGNRNQLELLVRDNKDLVSDDFCWYHAWRFYTGELTPDKLRDYLCSRQ